MSRGSHGYNVQQQSSCTFAPSPPTSNPGIENGNVPNHVQHGIEDIFENEKVDNQAPDVVIVVAEAVAVLFWRDCACPLDLANILFGTAN